MHEQHSDETPATDPVFDAPYEIEAFTEDEARSLFDEIACQNLGISGDEFRERWHRGDYDDDPDRPEIMAVVMSLPLVERRKLNQ